jgi:hypothetical protein
MSAYHVLSVKLSRSHIFLLLLLICVLSGCMDGGPPVRTPQTKGSIQLYDIHGKLICQLHGQNPQLSCLDKNAEQRKFAAYFIDYAVSELASDLHVNIVDLPSYGLNVSTTLDLDL